VPESGFYQNEKKTKEEKRALKETTDDTCKELTCKNDQGNRKLFASFNFFAFFCSTDSRLAWNPILALN
jgi:hypothetical protein